MTRYAVIADVHANRRALAAVTEAIARLAVGDVLCAGDLVGYNAAPTTCVAALRRQGVRSIAGNHDLIATRRLGFERCSPKAAFALRRTRRRIDRESAVYLRSLPDWLLVDDSILVVHGGVDDVGEYMHTPTAIARNAARVRERFPSARVCFFGHTHAQRVYRIDGDEVVEIAITGPVTLDLAAHRYFVNPGSVDAARRETGRRAEFAVFDTDTHTLEFFAVDYDHAAEERDAAREGYRMSPVRLWALARWRRARAAIAAHAPGPLRRLRDRLRARPAS